MTDLKLSKARPSGFLDIVLVDNDLQLVEGDDELRQRVEFKLEFFQGDFRPDISFGIPYYGRVFGRGVNVPDLYGIFVDAIQTEQGISYVERLDINIDAQTRVLMVDGAARATSGAEIPISFASGGIE